MLGFVGLFRSVFSGFKTILSLSLQQKNNDFYNIIRLVLI
ncbi:hypothetical protein FEM21_05380 [Flavobacterium seoulense]|uniref:Uncharacterized protein n=1 Tax=Flavobacterium seoulense TaxID=1492738 RepID=A0A066WZM5_9FLAO|nr:hypothetical protein FEM21_05380 [Flavobacterium seoulense]